MSSVAFSGRVVDEDGTAPDLPFQVELVCSGRIRQLTMTRPDGTFSFDLGMPRTEDWLDPSLGGSANGAIESVVREAPVGRGAKADEVPSMGQGRVSLGGCEVRVPPRPGLTSNSIRLETRSVFDNPDIGVIVVRKHAQPSAATVSLNTLSAPRKAREAFEEASEELAAADPKLAKAAKLLGKAIQEYPEFSAAWDLLARVQLSQGDAAGGRSSFLRAIEAEADFISPYLGLAQLSVQESNWPETISWTVRVLEHDALHPQALYWNGLANFYERNLDAAEKSLSELYRQDKARDYPFGLLPFGVIHAGQGRVEDAARELRQYLEYMPAEQVPTAQRAELEKQLEAWSSRGLAGNAPASAAGQESP